MNQQPGTIGHDAVADFALLIAEATGVLNTLAHEAPPSRPDELEELRSIIAEGLGSVCAIPEAATSADSVVALPEILRTMLADVMQLGEAIVDERTVLPGHQVSSIETMARALSAALDRMDDPAFVSAQARVISSCADTLGVAVSGRHPVDPVETLVVATSRAASGLHGLALAAASTPRQVAS